MRLIFLESKNSLNERHIATIVGLIVFSGGIIVFSGGIKNLRDWQSRSQMINAYKILSTASQVEIRICAANCRAL